MQDNKTQILITIISSILIAITSISAAFIARETITKYEYKELQNWGTTDAVKYFPLKVGNYWIYEGEADIANSSGITGVKRQSIKLKIEVTDVIKTDAATLFIISGQLSDVVSEFFGENNIMFSNKIYDVTRTRNGLLVVDNKVFQVSGEQLDDVIKSKGDNGFDGSILSLDDLYFEFPLYKGQRFGDIRSLLRDDLRYCSYVEGEVNYHATIDGKIQTLPVFYIKQNSIPAYNEIQFEPYLGITNFSFSHHGTEEEINISLKDYKIE